MRAPIAPSGVQRLFQMVSPKMGHPPTLWATCASALPPLLQQHFLYIHSTSPLFPGDCVSGCLPKRAYKHQDVAMVPETPSHFCFGAGRRISWHRSCRSLSWAHVLPWVEHKGSVPSWSGLHSLAEVYSGMSDMWLLNSSNKPLLLLKSAGKYFPSGKKEAELPKSVDVHRAAARLCCRVWHQNPLQSGGGASSDTKGTNPAAIGDRQESMRISASLCKEPGSKKRDGMGEEVFTAFAGANTAKQCQRRWVISAQDVLLKQLRSSPDFE